jgi:hypothetical protein
MERIAAKVQFYEEDHCIQKVLENAEKTQVVQLDGPDWLQQRPIHEAYANDYWHG